MHQRCSRALLFAGPRQHRWKSSTIFGSFVAPTRSFSVLAPFIAASHPNLSHSVPSNLGFIAARRSLNTEVATEEAAAPQPVQPPPHLRQKRKRFTKPEKNYSPTDPWVDPAWTLEIHEGPAARSKPLDELPEDAFVERDGEKIPIWKVMDYGGITFRLYQYIRFNGPVIRDLIYDEFRDDIANGGLKTHKKKQLSRQLNIMRKNHRWIRARMATKEEIRLKKLGKVVHVYECKPNWSTGRHHILTPAELEKKREGREQRREENATNWRKKRIPAFRAHGIKSWILSRI